MENMSMDAEERSKKINRVSIVTIIVNAVLSLIKLLAGIFASSAAMISDAVHSLSDVFSTFIVMIGIKLSKKKADSDHNFGHEKMESIASLLLAAILAATAVLIGISGFESIGRVAAGESIPIPGALALAAAVLSIVVKEWMYHYTRRTAKAVESTALMADAWHHRSDAFSSIGSLIGIGGAMLGFPILDPIASIIIALFILKVAYSISREATGQLTDRAADPQTHDEICRIVESVEGVAHVDSLRTRVYVNQLCLDIRISVPGQMTVEEGHAISHNVENAIYEKYHNIKSCIVHVNPD